MALDQSKPSARRLRLFLRDFRMIEAQVSLADGQSLAQFFAHRKQYINLRAARWANSGESVRFAALKVDQVLWAGALESDIPLVATMSGTAPREVEIQMEGGLLVRAGLIIGERQRLSDYLEAQLQFIPLRNAQLLKSGRPPKTVNLELGDVVLNQDAVQAVWEVEAQARAEDSAAAQSA